MLRLVKGTLRRLVGKLCSGSERTGQLPGVVSFSRSEQCEDHANELLYSMGYGNIVVLPLGSFSGKVYGEGNIPMADILCGIEKRIAQIP